MSYSDKTWTKILTIFYTALFLLLIADLLGGCTYVVKQGDPVRLGSK